MAQEFQTRSLRELASHFGTDLIGDSSTVVSGIAGIDSARPGDLVFAADVTRFQQAIQSPASAVVAADFARNSPAAKPCLIARNPKLTFAKIASLLCARETPEGHHESAQVHLSAQIGEHTSIGAGVVIAEAVTVGDFTAIGSNSVIGSGVRIGRECQIGPNVTIYQGTRLGDRVIVQAGTVLGSTGFGYVRDEERRHHIFPQIGGLLIEDEVEIGANCTIDRGSLGETVIRRGTKLDNLVHVGHNVEIGENTVIAAQTGISGSSRIGPAAMIGGQVGIGEHAELEAGTILGGQSGVLSGKVLRGNGAVLFGTPARPIKDFLREFATLARLARKGK
jgi:UDP-3-O-[3-hydroxymyristoyl] glucosamine N-acyltransferase